MATILVVDDEAVVREPIAASLRACGHVVLSAGDAKTALAYTKAGVMDLILLDVRMPEQDGISLLRKFRALPPTACVPVILLTSEMEKGVILEAARIGVQGYVLKSAFSLKELMERVNHFTKPKSTASAPAPATNGIKPAATAAPSTNGASNSASAPQTGAAVANPPKSAIKPGAGADPKKTAPDANGPIPHLLTREQCSDRVKEAVGGKTLGGIVAQVIAMAASPSTDMGELGSLIGRDPVLSARVLQVANSPAFTTSGKTIFNISDAVRQVGCSAIRDLAAAMGIFDALTRQTESSFDPLRCWMHSLTVAHLSQHLATMCQPDRAGLAYLIGLCHDLGEILLHTHFEEEFSQVLQVQSQTGKPLADLENAMLGVRRADLADMLLVHLGLPSAIRAPIEAFHRLAHSRGELSSPLSRILQMADLYANGMLLASDGSSPVAFLSISECRKSVGQDHPPTLDDGQLRSNMTVLTGMLARLAPHELKRLEPMHPKTAAKVWLARHPAVSQWNPFAAALRAMSAEVRVEDHLPGPQDFGNFTHMVIAAPTIGAKGFGAAAIEAAAGPLPPETKTIWVVGQKEAGGKAGTGLLPTSLPLTLDQLAGMLAA